MECPFQNSDPWALEAASRPVAFSQVREDPELDLNLIASHLPGADAMMIASGGETAIRLSKHKLKRLILVDMNQAQLALTRCKFHLANHYAPRERLALLGHSDMSAALRKSGWLEIFDELILAEDIFGDPESVFRLGPDYCGRYEAAFAEIRHQLMPCEAEVMSFLQSPTPTAPPTVIGEILERVFSLKNLVTLFGEEATQNPRRPFHEHFTRMFYDFALRMPPATNPWVWQFLRAEFPENAPYEWLTEIEKPIVEPEYIHEPMAKALKHTPEDSLDFLHLSNILDWLSPNEAQEVLTEAHRALRHGGHLIIRQLNSSLEIPSLFPELDWDLEKGRLLQSTDRSFFYPEILVAVRP